MENLTLTTPPTERKQAPLWLVVVLAFVLLINGGFAFWFWLKGTALQREIRELSQRQVQVPAQDAVASQGNGGAPISQRIIGAFVTRQIADDNVKELTISERGGMLFINTQTPEGSRSLRREAVLALAGSGFVLNDVVGSIAGVNPEDPNRVYFMATAVDTSSVDSDGLPSKVINALFQYHLETGSLEEVYRDEKSGNIRRTLGSAGSKIVIVGYVPEFSPGPCFSPWLDNNSLQYFELADPQRGLQVYQQSPEKVSAEVKKKQLCEAEFE